MPAVRLLPHRRRSSIAQGLNPIKAGRYGVRSPSPARPVQFAPNVTPVSFAEPEDDSSDLDEPGSPSAATLFPPSQEPAPTQTRRRVPPGKRPSQGYIPRPPNAFMLFRAEFVKQKHVPGSIETSHGSLSKIIGNCWRSLPLDEKKVWEKRARAAKAEHKVKYPHYRFRPVHDKTKSKKKEKPQIAPEEERRCETVAALLLEGKKGDILAEAVKAYDQKSYRSPTPPAPRWPHRRSSSVPPPSTLYAHNPISLPSAPFLSLSRPDSPTGMNINNMSRSERYQLGINQRRPSSAQPQASRGWLSPQDVMQHMYLQRDPSPLPDVDATLFERSFLEGSSFGFQPQPEMGVGPFNMSNFYTTLPPPVPPTDVSIAPHELVPPNFAPNNQHLHLDTAGWVPGLSSEPSSTYSGSPAPSEPLELGGYSIASVHAPQPQHPQPMQHWKDYSVAPGEPDMSMQAMDGCGELNMGNYMHMQQQQHMEQYPGVGYDNVAELSGQMYDPSSSPEHYLDQGYGGPNMGCGGEVQQHGMDFDFNDMINEHAY
ncbi:hypothetical protein JAAARDRAFT_62109 [Jaapia argillacea MUCL 33604]|uniref:HMG box domain-containing protein n=1 Tax=Jaapia argillacea MUCL 33604 TaxID=933084 RepID=A0A067PEA7_9AGAM|nr:hypothetical protein JAAARDRAFT_62109 [Jaapia argillacea MUCL 33604]